jgi:hypothetical protein
LACGPREEKLARDLGEALRAGEERGRGREGADRRGPVGSERERCTWSGWAEEGSGPGRGPCGRKRGEGPRGGIEWEPGRGERAGPRGLGCFLFLFFSYTQTFQTILFQINLNSNPIHSTQIKQCFSMNAQTS